MQHGRQTYTQYQYTDFDEIKEIGSGCYKTVYTARRKHDSVIVVLKRFKNSWSDGGIVH